MVLIIQKFLGEVKELNHGFWREKQPSPECNGKRFYRAKRGVKTGSGIGIAETWKVSKTT
jgi:hypothetical protein